MTELFEKRALFTKLLPLLIDKMLESGDTPLLGPEHVKHMENSLHYVGLAKDIDLFRDGIYCTKSEDHKKYGEYWKSLHPDCRWGGDFKHADGNHYSVTYQGRK